jgi:hypothetical protein
VEKIPELIDLDPNPIIALPPGEGRLIADTRMRVEAESRQ